MSKVVFLDRQLNHEATIMLDEDIIVEDIIADAKITITSPFINKQLKTNGICLVYSNDSTVDTFIGIINKTTREANKELLKVEIKHISEAFNIQGIAGEINGNVFNYIKDLLESNFLTITDEKLKINIAVVNNMSESYALNHEFGTRNIKEILKQLFDLVGVYLKYQIVYNISGKPEQIKILVCNNKEENQIIMKYSNPIIFELNTVFENTNNNKVVFVPDKENSLVNIYRYYLTRNGAITTNEADPDRFEQVKQVILEYKQDETLPELEERAKSELLGKSYTHNITFNIVRNASFPLDLYKRVLFYDESGIYDTIVTKRIVQGNIHKVTLGSLRLTLTDKLKISLTR